MPKSQKYCIYFIQLFMFFLITFAMYLKNYYFCKNN